MVAELLQQLGLLLATVVVYASALKLYQKSSAAAVLHPLPVAAFCIFAVLYATNTGIDEYQQATALLEWLLGPATVALALPLYRQIQVVRNLGWQVVIPILCGGILAPLTAWFAVYLGAAGEQLQTTMLVKSITTPFAVEVATITGGIPALAAGIVIVTGIVGAISSPYVFALLRIQSDAAKGVALGTVAHAIGTARALQMNETTAALATLALCLNGIITAFVIPIIFAR